jgi:diketogulonate reductase-like aldo/keto reductase
MKNCPFTDATVGKIATAHSVSTAQVCLRWILDKGCVMAVGTGSDAAKAAKYAKEDLDIFGFALTADEIASLDKLGQ